MVSRQFNFTSQLRLDSPFLRSMESSVANDFDMMAGVSLAGKEPQVISGLHMITTGITLATSLILQVADSVLIHFLATASGSLFHIDAAEIDQGLSSTNPKIVGGWSTSAVNYLSLDIIRAPSSTTEDLVEVIDTISLTETPVTQPLGILTDYRICINTLDFDTTNTCPIAKITLDAGGAILAIQDARNFMFRLGSGGTIPNVLNSYSWPGGRKEIVTGDTFAGTDKSITSFKQWNDSIMTRLWELGGGQSWYSPTADRNIRLTQTGTPFVSTGMNFEFVASNLHWKGLTFIFDNSDATFNTIADQTSNVAGLTDLVNGECLYVDFDRTTNRSGGTSLVAQKGVLATLGTPTIPGSRWVLAWNYNGNIYIRDQVYAVGSSFLLATTTAAGMVELSATDSGGASPTKVATVDQTFNGAAIAAGLSRGNGDYFGGSGGLVIGSGTHDFGIQLITTRSADEIQLFGSERWTTSATSTLDATNLDPFDSNPLNKVARFRGFRASNSEIETGVAIEPNGMIGFRNAVVTNSGSIAFTPTATEPIRNKVYFDINGLSTPNSRDQMKIIDTAGNISILWESTAY